VNYLYCGGRFHFDYQREDYLRNAEDDFRTAVLENVSRLLHPSDNVLLSAGLSYVGPFYFESDGMIDREIVETEMRQIERCTHAFFLLEDAGCPGTVGEMIHAAELGKNLTVFYIRDTGETESTLQSSCWYPILLASIICCDGPEIIACEDMEDAKNKILQKVEILKQKTPL